MGNELKDQVVIVTGAAEGMGKSVVERLALEGARPVLVDLQWDLLLEVASRLDREGFETRVHCCDVTSEEQVDIMVRTVMEDLGHIDILVNCAGIMFPSRFPDMTVDEWDQVMAVNLRGTFLTMHRIFPIMKENGGGTIINFSSTAGLTVSTLGGAHYTASKHGVIGLTKAVAKEGGPHGIRVNAVCPGLIDTDMVTRTLGKETIEGYSASFPIPRLGRPQEVAELVLFLASERSAYITGASLNISGGDLM